MRVLVLNCGSSSLKVQLVDTDRARAAAGTDRVLARGLVDNIGAAAVLRYETDDGRKKSESEEILEHKIAVERVLALLADPEVGVVARREEVDAVGHRVVHGGERFKTSVRIDDEVLRGIEACFDLAPLHNPPNVKGYRAARELLGPDVPQVAVFDTAFHQTMPAEAYLYGIPYVLYERHGIRRYGFHGTSHRYVSARLAARLGRRADDPELRLVTCHLGNGCSVAAIRGGRSIDTSMGFTPLEGLVMGTRSGDMDPAILLYVMRKEELGPWEANALLNKHSGLIGISGVSNDMRQLLEAEASGHARARMAVDVFCYRLAKYIAAYAAVLGGADAVAFAGGIGENAPVIRQRVLSRLEALGLRVDEATNGVRGQETRISPEGARPEAWVVPTNEEILIARDTLHIATGEGAGPGAA
ncbi:MAG TPA: acetate kinase [Vicinamibacteria bacterium]|nr:acetate kinase [Vicinamibacteria bacterium]